jgi:GntR family transcriptional regulator
MRLGYREIAAELRREITEGVYRPGTLLPSEPELGARFGGASRSLVNRAMQSLAAEGLVRARQGRGTVVTWLPPMIHSAARYSRQAREDGGARGAFDNEIRKLGLEPQHEITVERAVPPPDIAQALGVAADQPSCLVRRRRLLASGIPVRLNASWFPLSIAAGTVLEEPAPVITGGVKSALADLGYPQTSATERVIVRLPAGQEAGDLEISPDRTVLEITHTGRLTDSRAIEVTTTLTPSNYIILEQDFPLT